MKIQRTAANIPHRKSNDCGLHPVIFRTSWVNTPTRRISLVKQYFWVYSQFVDFIRWLFFLVQSAIFESAAEPKIFIPTGDGRGWKQHQGKKMNGTVKWFNPTKGFGFIQSESGGPDIFVHISEVQKAGLSGLTENQHVSFDVAENKGRKAATNLVSVQESAGDNIKKGGKK